MRIRRKPIASRIPWLRAIVWARKRGFLLRMVERNGKPKPHLYPNQWKTR